jgi:hypothetical protein
VYHVDFKGEQGEGSFAWQTFGKRSVRGERPLQGLIDRAARDALHQLRSNLLRFNATPGNVDWYDVTSSAITTNARLAARGVASVEERWHPVRHRALRSAALGLHPPEGTPASALRRLLAQAAARREVMEVRAGLTADVFPDVRPQLRRLADVRAIRNRTPR